MKISPGQGQPEDDARRALAPTKGRGAASRVAGRFEKRELRGEDDGWGSVYDELDDAPSPRTQQAASGDRAWTPPAPQEKNFFERLFGG